MRKGADCLSKWVGEAERQLRLLFDQAKAHQPSIIFFDEIDGLTPVRSSKQDQIHSSIVSTLLALMDGLDKRGQVIVIGATNRVDAIDPALRRPGRFDREMFFALPDRAGRREILDIHLRTWQPPLASSLLDHLSELTAGYAGADLKALCTEAALCALHRVYPQIYHSERKLKLDHSRIRVEADDFLQAMQKITPSSHRAGPQHADPMPSYLRGLLGALCEQSIEAAHAVFPFFASDLGHTNLLQRRALTEADSPALCFRPRLVLTAHSEAAVDAVAKAVLYALDGCYQLQLDLLSLTREGTLAESLCSAVREAFHHAPAVLFLPRVDLCLQQSGTDDLLSVLAMAMASLPPTAPVLLVATSVQLEGKLMDMDMDMDMNMEMEMNADLTALPLFAAPATTKYFHVPEPTMEKAEAFILQLLPLLVSPSAVQNRMGTDRNTNGDKKNDGREEEELEFADEETTPSRLIESEEVKAARRDKEEHYLREERTFFREILYSLSRNPRYRCFVDRVNEEDVPDYYDIIKHPMWFDKMFDKVDRKEYLTLDMFMDDIHLIVDNAKEYNPVASGKKILRAGSSLLDEVESTVRRFKKKLHYDVFAKCDAIVARRKKEAEEEAAVAEERKKQQQVLRKEELARKRKEKKEKKEESMRKRRETLARKRREKLGENELVQEMETETSFISHEGGSVMESEGEEKEKENVMKKEKEKREGSNGEKSNMSESAKEKEEKKKKEEDLQPAVSEELVEAGRKALLAILHQQECLEYDYLISLYARLRRQIGMMDLEPMSVEERIQVSLMEMEGMML